MHESTLDGGVGKGWRTTTSSEAVLVGAVVRCIPHNDRRPQEVAWNVLETARGEVIQAVGVVVDVAVGAAADEVCHK